MANDSCLIFFRSGRCDLNGAAKAFADAKLSVTRRGDELTVSYRNGPPLRVVYSTDDAEEEARDIAKSHPPAAALLPCDARFEILIDDLDATLYEYGTLFEVQAALIEATGGFAFNTWNCLFPWPNE